MSPRVAIVTGGNKGIGFAVARGLSKQFKVSDPPMLIPYVNTYRVTHLLVDWVVFHSECSTVFSTWLELMVICQNRPYISIQPRSTSGWDTTFNEKQIYLFRNSEKLGIEETKNQTKIAVNGN